MWWFSSYPLVFPSKLSPFEVFSPIYFVCEDVRALFFAMIGLIGTRPKYTRRVRRKFLLASWGGARIGKLFYQVIRIMFARNIRRIGFPCTRSFLKTWGLDFLSPTFGGACFSGRSCPPRSCTRNLIPLWRRSSLFASTSRLLPPKIYFLPYSLYIEGWREAEDRVGFPYAKTRRCSTSLLGKLRASRSTSYWWGWV
jgi:hypothetical protein